MSARSDMPVPSISLTHYVLFFPVHNGSVVRNYIGSLTREMLLLSLHNTTLLSMSKSWRQNAILLLPQDRMCKVFVREVSLYPVTHSMV